MDDEAIEREIILSTLPEPARCSACGGTDHIRVGSLWHSAPICKPCFYIWYDPPEGMDVTDPRAIGKYSRKAKAEGLYPWTHEFAAKQPFADPGVRRTAED